MEQELNIQVPSPGRKQQPSVLILFGHSGAGKHTIGKELELKYGYHLHDGNKDYLPEMRRNFETQTLHTPEQRDEHARRMISRINELRAVHTRLVVVQALVMERHRLMIHEAIPDARFIYVTAPPSLREKRVATRQGHHVNTDYLAKLEAIYEEPTLPHFRLVNDTLGIENITDQLRGILDL